jgi:predicted RNA-binding protein associated with RNAse of E/G family
MTPALGGVPVSGRAVGESGAGVGATPARAGVPEVDSSGVLGEAFLVTETWRGLLWSAVPHVLVERADGWLITFVPEGTVGAYASSRGRPGTEGLSRSERKLLALETLEYTVAESAQSISTLNFFTRSAWSRVTLGWDETGFLGWYVNFELPYSETPRGLDTMDLILDLPIDPSGEYEWKDQADYDEALRRGLLTPEIAEALVGETTRVLAQLAAAEGPFAPHWTAYSEKHPIPELPHEYRAAGQAWG